MPVYFAALWMGGSWLARHQSGLSLTTLGLAAVSLLVSESLCYLISKGSFYWLSHSVPLPRSFGSWFANLGDWYLPFLATTALYVGIGAVLHVGVTLLARTLRQSDRTGLSH
jgi:Na+/melibiose symporter-like transporter